MAGSTAIQNTHAHAHAHTHTQILCKIAILNHFFLIMLPALLSALFC